MLSQKLYDFSSYIERGFVQCTYVDYDDWQTFVNVSSTFSTYTVQITDPSQKDQF
jgi:hypothetical protein